MDSYVGTIKSFNTVKGWGFIECSETFATYNKDIFVMKTSLPAGGCSTGTSVAFTLKDGNNGVEAHNVTRVNGFAPSMMGAHGGNLYSGEIKSFNPSKGWGLISCAETFQEYGKDIFVLKTSLPGGHASAGDPVQFSVRQGEKGPEATDVQSPNAGYSGTIKSFNEQKGWGLIACQETAKIYGKDMFVLKTNLPNGRLEVGMPVRFSVITGQKGPEAANVKSAVSVPMNGRNGSKGKSFVSSPVPPQRTLTGTIKSFNEAKGWGFITPSGTSSKSLPQDVFFMRTGLQAATISVGENVEFKVVNGKKGLEANEISPMFSVHGLAGQPLTGVVKSYKEAKGWGFITGDNVIQMFGRDIFFHQKDVGDQVPVAGAKAEFIVATNEQGQPQATNLQFWSDQAFAPMKMAKTRPTPYGARA